MHQYKAQSPQPPLRHGKHAGFTLLEMMVAVTVLLIGLMVAVPSFQSLNVDSALTSDAQRMTSLINYARTEAIKLNRYVVICNTSNGTSCSTDTDAWKGWLIGEERAGQLARVLQSGTFAKGTQVKLHGLKDRTLYSQLYITPLGFMRNGSKLPLSMQMFICLPSKNTSNRRKLELHTGGRIVTTIDNGGETCSNA